MSRDTIRARVAAATEGPWRWGGNVDNREVYLSTVAHGRIFVMRFARWGMHAAQPLLRNDLGMRPASEWVVRERPYRGDIETVEHPDAQFIAHARQDIPAMLAVADAAAEMLDEVMCHATSGGTEGKWCIEHDVPMTGANQCFTSDRWRAALAALEALP